MAEYDKNDEYTTLLVDTSIFDRYKQILHSGLISKLYQFHDSEYKLILPEIIKKELESHLHEKIVGTYTTLKKH